MKENQACGKSLAWLAATLLVGCATRPAVDVPAPPATVASYDEKIVRVNESSMLPLLGYSQLLAQMSPQELVRERAVLLYIPPTPSTQTATTPPTGRSAASWTRLTRFAPIFRSSARMCWARAGAAPGRWRC